jgi:hypothetical protein
LPLKKRLFVGSASESLNVAYAVQEELDRALEVTVWTQGIFHPSRTTMESLTEQPKKFDAALFVFTPDDALILRGETKRAVRDNVIFELGLFVGALGRQQTFILLPRDVNELHLPSDLAGVTPLDYNHQRQDRNLVAAVGPACNKIKNALIPGYGTMPAGASHDSESLEKLLVSRPHRLIFNPKSMAAKRIIFGPSGIIVEGNNRNEHRGGCPGGSLSWCSLTTECTVGLSTILRRTSGSTRMTTTRCQSVASTSSRNDDGLTDHCSRPRLVRSRAAASLKSSR